MTYYELDHFFDEKNANAQTGCASITFQSEKKSYTLLGTVATADLTVVFLFLIYLLIYLVTSI